MQDTFFHGTGEDFEGPLKGGAYDDMIWTADNPAVAQNYIPATGMKSGFSLDQWANDDERYPNYAFRYPKGTDITLLKQIGHGYPVDYELLPNGEIKSFTYKDRPATYGEIRAYLRSLGYDEDDFWLRSGYTDDGEVVYPKKHKLPGRLFIGTPKTPLNIFDTSDFLEHDIGNPAYHNHSLFKKLRDTGYHGVKIPDFAQSEKWGNVNHYSTGIFPEHAEKLDWQTIPATNFDWDDKIAGVYSTPEFDQWRFEQ